MTIMKFSIAFLITFCLFLYLSIRFSVVVACLLLTCAFVLYFVAITGHRIYALVYSTDMRRLERIVCRGKNQPFLGYVYAMGCKDYVIARERAQRIRNPMRRMEYLASVACAQGRWEEVESLLSNVQNEEVKKYIRALMALRQQDWRKFYELKAQIKHTVNKLLLDSEEADAHGDKVAAERFRSEAILRSRGVVRYVLIKKTEMNCSDAEPQVFL